MKTIFKLTKKNLFISLFLFNTVFSCKPIETKPKDEGAGQEEVITKVTLHFTNLFDSTDHTMAVYNDADGNGPQAPTIDSLLLKKGIIYKANIQLIDGINNEDLTQEIEKEGEKHCFHYSFISPSSNSELKALAYDLNKDKNNLNLGLSFKLQTSTVTGSGNFYILLKHFGEGETKTENPLDGSTDVDISFPTQIR